LPTEGLDSHFSARPDLVADVQCRGGIVANQDDGETGNYAGSGSQSLDPCRACQPHAGCDLFSVDDLCGHALFCIESLSMPAANDITNGQMKKIARFAKLA
jgi:hypothetical protein